MLTYYLSRHLTFYHSRHFSMHYSLSLYAYVLTETLNPKPYLSMRMCLLTISLCILW